MVTFIFFAKWLHLYANIALNLNFLLLYSPYFCVSKTPKQQDSLPLLFTLSWIIITPPTFKHCFVLIQDLLSSWKTWMQTRKKFILHVLYKSSSPFSPLQRTGTKDQKSVLTLDHIKSIMMQSVHEESRTAFTAAQNWHLLYNRDIIINRWSLVLKQQDTLPAFFTICCSCW